MLGTGWWLSVRGTSGLVYTMHTHHPPDPLWSWTELSEVGELTPPPHLTPPPTGSMEETPGLPGCGPMEPGQDSTAVCHVP